MIKKIFLKGCLALLLLLGLNLSAQEIPSPKSHFGFNIGDNFQLANYSQTAAYFQKLAASSKRVKLVDIGKTEEGRSQYMLIITSPKNQKNLEKYKVISQKLARAEDLTDKEAKELATQGKAVVWIDGGLHATETVGAHQLILTAYNLASRTDAETNRILDDVIVLIVHANPDGQELQSDWYMKEKTPEKRKLGNLPRLYQKYAGHDNNRDFFMFNLKETQNMGRQLFIEWNPQIMYNHHQRGPAGTIVAGPPFRDPHNYVFDPIILTSLDAVGAAMHNRLNIEDKPGYTQRGGSVFSTWYNGGLRTTTYFHNMIGLLTEIQGSPNPIDIPLVLSRLLPNSDSPNPVSPRKFYFKDAMDYSLAMNYAVLNYAQRYHDELLFNIYKMGKNSIDRGNTDTWSISPHKIEALKEVVKADKSSSTGKDVTDFNKVMTAPETRDARGYIIPSDQADFTTAVRFLNALIRGGIEVQKATKDFTVEGKKYPEGSYIVKTNQAFRPHILDMFEPQDHPNDFKYPGGPPVAPYDAAGWTLAYLMNVKFDRILNTFDGPFVKQPIGELLKLSAQTLPNTKGFVLSAQSNESFLAVNELLKAKAEVYRNPSDGSFYTPSNDKSKRVLNKLEGNFGMKVSSSTSEPKNAILLKSAKIALWDRYGGSMPSGWIRYIMEEYHYDITVVYPPDIDAGKLKDYDVLILVGGSIPNLDAKSIGKRVSTKSISEEDKELIGVMSQEKSIPQLKSFIKNGGQVVAIGTSTNLAYHLGLPIKNALTTTIEGKEKELSPEEYYIPGSVLRVKVDTKQAANWGLEEQTDVYFSKSSVFKLTSNDGKVKPLAWFDTDSALRSGWAWGQAYLKNGIAAFEANYGNGKLYGFGPEITFRAQTHGTFKWLFNRLYK